MGKTRSIYEIIHREASEIEFILNRTIDFAKTEDNDHNERRFVVGRMSATPRHNPSLPRKYGMAIYYVRNGTRYTVIEPRMKVLDYTNVWEYIEMFRGFANDISNGYSGKPITDLDRDFAELVDSGRIKKTDSKGSE